MKVGTFSSAVFTLMAELIPSNSTEGQVVLNPNNIKLPTATTTSNGSSRSSLSYLMNHRLGLLAIFSALL